jgi:hypothetical protein
VGVTDPSRKRGFDTKRIIGRGKFTFARFRQAMTCCSRFCNGQSTQEPQRSTSDVLHSVRCSIRSTYFHPDFSRFNKQRDLFWEQRAGGSNPSAPTNVFSVLLMSGLGHLLFGQMRQRRYWLFALPRMQTRLQKYLHQIGS